MCVIATIVQANHRVLLVVEKNNFGGVNMSYQKGWQGWLDDLSWLLKMVLLGGLAIGGLAACSSSPQATTEHQTYSDEDGDGIVDRVDESGDLVSRARYSGWSGWIDTLSVEEVAKLNQIKGELKQYAKDVGSKYPGRFDRATFSEEEFETMTGYKSQTKLLQAYAKAPFDEIFEEYEPQVEDFISTYNDKFMFGELTDQQYTARQISYDALKGLYVALQQSYYKKSNLGQVTSQDTLALSLALDMHNYIFIIKDDIRGLAFNYDNGDYILPCNVKEQIKRNKQTNQDLIDKADFYLEIESQVEPFKIIKKQLRQMRTRWQNLVSQLTTNDQYKDYAKELKKLVKSKLQTTFPEQTSFGLCEMFSQ